MRLTYIGRRPNKGKLVHAFYDGDERGPFTFFPKAKASRFGSCQIGTIYEIADDAALPTFWPSVKVGTADAHDCLEWEARDRAEEMASRKVETSPQLTKLVANLRAARLNLTPVQRVAFDAWLLNSIR